MSSLLPDNNDNIQTAANAVPEELRCLYTQSVCIRERAIKIDGMRHNLCDYHRDKANAAQRRSSNKKRDENRRKRVLRLAKAHAAKLGVPVESLLNTGVFRSDLVLDESDLIASSEGNNDGVFQIENFSLSGEDLNWLIESLRTSTND